MDINKIKNGLIEQKKSKFKGSRLASEQTEAIFTTSSFILKNESLIKLNDLIESKKNYKLKFSN